ncbi:DUF4097 family beta strand repeat-containing protein [Streptomyces sp. NPDC048416]|uniref:DUF4097 family beta strand repeat-containing protein n=1 Tax=Streptomyces sp. NPDC048416 TaxID=3365546 RepID=UPI003710D845
MGALFIVVPLALSLLADSVSRSGAYASPDNNRPHAVSEVEVESGSAQITVTPGPAGRVTVDGELGWLLKRPRIDRTWEGDTLKVHTECDGFVDQYVHTCQVGLHLTVPAGVSLTVRSASGEIDVRDLTGPVDLRSGSGGMKLRGLKGTVAATVGSGEIEAAQLASPEADLEAGSGTVRAEFSTPPRRVSATAGSGAVSLTVPDATRYQVLGHSDSGGRDIQNALVDKASDRILDVTSGSGSVAVGYPGWDPDAHPAH